MKDNREKLLEKTFEVMKAEATKIMQPCAVSLISYIEHFNDKRIIMRMRNPYRGNRENGPVSEEITFEIYKQYQWLRILVGVNFSDAWYVQLMCANIYPTTDWEDVKIIVDRAIDSIACWTAHKNNENNLEMIVADVDGLPEQLENK